VYFKAQASHLSHLARKLEAAVDQAMQLSPETRRAMTADALLKRFPADEMMEAYGDAWSKVRRERELGASDAASQVLGCLLQASVILVLCPEAASVLSSFCCCCSCSVCLQRNAQINYSYVKTLQVRRRQLENLNAQAHFFGELPRMAPVITGR
jgi:hypothetical protein